MFTSYIMRATCSVGVVQNLAFEGFKSKSIDLQSIGIHTLERMAFVGLNESLEALHLDGNQIAFLPGW